MPSENARVADAQRRALFAAEVIVNRRLHDFSMRYQTQYSNDVAIERKAIEKEIRAIRRRVPWAPLVDDALAGAVAEAAGVSAEQSAAVLRALATLRPDVLSLEPAPAFDDEDEDEG